MKKYIILPILLIIGITFNANMSYAIDPDCLQMVMDNDGATVSNPDSVMVDICTDSPSYGQWYAKKKISVSFNVYPFQEIPISIGEYKAWQDIDTNYPVLRQIFQNVESKYGNFILLREDSNEVEHLTSKSFLIEFDNYVCIDSLSHDVDIDNSYILALVLVHPPYVMGVKEEINSNDIIISTNGNQLKLEFITNHINNDIKIADIIGTIIKPVFSISNNNMVIDISHLSTGVYFLLIDNIKPIKFIKY